MKLIRNELTPKERLKLYAQGKEVDRIPVTMSAGETSPLLYGINISDYYFSSDYMVEVESNLARDFGADNMGMGLGLRTLVEALGTKLSYPKENVSYIIEPAIKDYSEIDNLEPANIEKDGRLPIMIEAFKRLIDKYGDERVISTSIAGPLTTATSLIGTEKFLKDSIRRKEDVHKLLKYSTDCIIKCAKDLNEMLGITVSIAEPLAAQNVISLKQFRELEKPYLANVVDGFKEFQNAPGIHVCGNTKDRWLDLCETGIGGFSIDNCECMRELKEICGDRIGIVGNIPPVDILKEGTPEMIFDEVKNCIIKASDSSKGFTLSPGCSVPVHTSKENIVAMMNAASIYGKGAKKGSLPRGIIEFI